MSAVTLPPVGVVVCEAVRLGAAQVFLPCCSNQTCPSEVKRSFCCPLDTSAVDTMPAVCPPCAAPIKSSGRPEVGPSVVVLLLLNVLCLFE
jgi:hypothetical protein